MAGLTALQVKNAKPGRHADGAGLYLLVRDTGSRSWLLRVMVAGKRRDFGLGSVAELSLASAREKADEWRAIAKEGRDPSMVKRAEVRAQAREDAKASRTFEAAAAEFMAAHSPSWRNEKHKAQWTYTLREFAYPKIGAEPVNEIDAPMIVDTLMPIWQRLPETARRLRQRIGAVLDYAHARNWRDREAPMRAVLKAMPKQTSQKQHFAAVPYPDAPTVIAALRKADATVGRAALEFTILTAARSGEARGARWSEVDLEAKTWTIPAERMKAKRAHIVPLTSQAIALLENLKPLAKAADGLIFPGLRAKPLSDMTMSKVQRALAPGTTVHGWRSCFRDWVAETTNFSGELAEMALAHSVASKVEKAYRRGNLLERRRELMDAWAWYLDGKSATVLQFRPQAVEASA